MLLKKVNNSICNKFKFGKISLAGRNNQGHITVWHRGGGMLRMFRIVDFFRYIWNVKGILLTIEYDTNRTAPISLISYSNSVLSTILTAQNSFISSIVTNSNIKKNYEFRNNYCANLNYIKPGIYINNLEFKPLSGLKYVRSGLNYAKLVSTAQNYSIIKLRSKTLLRVSNLCLAVIGVLWGRKNFLLNNFKNAGYNRRIGKRPVVRGVAMNPIDHPHGGGQGKTSGGRPSVTPWGKITKGRKTARKIRNGSFILER